MNGLLQVLRFFVTEQGPACAMATWFNAMAKSWLVTCIPKETVRSWKTSLECIPEIGLDIFSRNLEKRSQFSGSAWKNTPAPPPAAPPGRWRDLARGIFQADHENWFLFSGFPENMPSPIFRNAPKQGVSGSHYLLRDASYQAPGTRDQGRRTQNPMTRERVKSGRQPP